MVLSKRMSRSLEEAVDYKVTRILVYYSSRTLSLTDICENSPIVNNSLKNKEASFRCGTRNSEHHEHSKTPRMAKEHRRSRAQLIANVRILMLRIVESGNDQICRQGLTPRKSTRVDPECQKFLYIQTSVLVPTVLLVCSQGTDCGASLIPGCLNEYQVYLQSPCMV